MASLYDSASLVMIPSGVKEDKLYSIKPTDGSGDFTFSRGSDIEATRVNSSGNIEKARNNQLLQSNTFSNASWTKTRATLTGGQAGYDGTNDAWAFVDDTNNSTHLLYQPLSSLGADVATMSVYAKKGDVDFMAFRFEGAAVDYAYFDLANGTLGTIDSDYIEARITSVGGGWYRCEATRVLAASGNQAIMLSAETDNDPTYAGAGTAAIYIQDAQVNYGLIAQDYVETTTTAVVEGLTADLPRLDYSGGASCPSLLLEPSRTNNVLQSEYFGTYWSPNQMSVSSNVGTSPEGVVNAGLLIPSTSSTSTHRIRGVVSVTAGQNHTFSCFFKKENYAYAQLRSGTGWQINVDLNDGSFTTSGTSLVDGDVEDYGNGWYRAYVVGTEAGTSQGFDISVFNSDSFGGFAGDGTSGIYAYGAQVEQGSYPTSYIPTYGTAANRGADLCTEGGDADTYNDSEGTLFAEIFIEEEIDENVNLSISNGVHAQNLFKFIYLPTNNELRFEVYGSSLDTRIQKFNLSLGVYHKLAGSYDGTNTKLYIDGVEVNTTSTNQLPTGLNQFNFDRADGSAPFTGNVKQLLYFPTALTNAELAALTTI